MTDEFRAKMLERALELALSDLQCYVGLLEQDEILKNLHPEVLRNYEYCSKHLELFRDKNPDLPVTGQLELPLDNPNE